MLYDPKWEVQTKPDVFSLEGLIAWLEKMPADGSYVWEDCGGGCLIGLYAAAHGFTFVEMCTGRRGQTPYSRLVGPNRTVAYQEPHTFGAALDRARKALSPSNHPGIEGR